MIQKNRIMTKKGIIIFDRNIDVEKTQENGKKVGLTSNLVTLL